MEEKEIGHIDLSPQINNLWSKDSALALKKGKIWFAVKIRGKDKQDLKKLFIRDFRKTKEVRKNNQRVIVIIYSYMLELKTTISQVCLPSSLTISILSSGKTSITDKPPPLT